MDLIPIEPTGDFKDFLASAFSFPLKLKTINSAGDYEKENIVFEATEDIESLYDFILFFTVEDDETGLPVYDKCRLLTFDEIELQKGDLLQIYTRKGDDKTTLDTDAIAFCNVIYWGLSEPIWHTPHSSFEIMKRSESYSGSPDING